MSNKKITDHEKKFREELEAIKKASREKMRLTEEVTKNKSSDTFSAELTDLSGKVADLVKRIIEQDKRIAKMESETPIKTELLIPDFGRVVVEDSLKVEKYQKLLDDILLGNNVFLVGEAGTGKTFTADVVCHLLYGEPQDFKMTINCSQWTAPRDIIGGDTIEGYKEGRLIQAWEKGYLLVLDELPKLDPNTAGLLNDALAMTSKKNAVIRNGDGRAVVKHDKFGVIATGNITGKEVSAKYSGNNKQDASLIDRFTGSYYHIDFDETLEQSIVAPVVFKTYSAMRNILLSEGLANDITLRTMLNADRTYNLEMFRFINGKNIANGKRLRDSLESYLFTAGGDIAKKLKNITEVAKVLGGQYLDSMPVQEYKKWKKL